MKKIKDLISCCYDIDITGIEIDSRKIKKGNLFVAIEGFNIDHNLFIDDAIKNGAAAIITTKKQERSVPVIVVDNIEKSLTEICKKYYDYNDSLTLIGITGTDGKTTTATILQELLSKKEKTAYMGTNGIKIDDKYEPTGNTTPSIEDIYYYLGKIEKTNHKNLVLEVSSEALLHKRVENLKFKYAIYTNITEDHLNIHKTVENYIKAKNHLTDLVDKNGYIIINGDDRNCKKLKTYNKNIITYGKESTNDYKIINIKESETTKFTIQYKENIYNFETNLKGEYNIYNLTAAIIICILENISIEKIKKYIKIINQVPGRREYLDYGQNYTIVLDYAHTENGIKTIVESFKNLNRRITVLTGSAGGREKEKRPRIGKYLLDNVDTVVFTMDDPRYESVDDIIDDMTSTSNKTNYKRIINRKDAIKYTLDNAQENDIILILGKGRDNYMAIEDKKIKYSDFDEIKKYFHHS